MGHLLPIFPYMKSSLNKKGHNLSTDIRIIGFIQIQENLEKALFCMVREESRVDTNLPKLGKNQGKSLGFRLFFYLLYENYIHMIIIHNFM